MTQATGIHIGRLVIDGRELTAEQARELAQRIAIELGRDWPVGAPGVSRVNLQVTAAATGDLALPALARTVARALQRELL
ncbi:hypothetical protein [uncultured Thiodictyon sp.]|uniref:hypothetical protein n=1 Tax=uncultured Thiodictyon sp. TaxID=1846217 RepID=UPI0025DA378D|nr:hypothetical protein [uncultured Thiodictyon sp.]